MGLPTVEFCANCDSLYLPAYHVQVRGGATQGVEAVGEREAGGHVAAQPRVALPVEPIDSGRTRRLFDPDEVVEPDQPAISRRHQQAPDGAHVAADRKSVV